MATFVNADIVAIESSSTTAVTTSEEPFFTGQEKIYDCIIIGAGVSGMQTAKSLILQHGLRAENILLLEAQDYIGGRVRQNTDFIANVKVELGAEILHGKNTELTQFAAEHDEPIDEMFIWAHGDGGPLEAPVGNGYGLYYVGNGSKKGRLMRFDDQDADFVHVNGELLLLSKLHEDDFTLEPSLQEYLAKRGCSDDMIRMADAGFANTLCIEIEELSLKQSVKWSRLWHEETKDEGDFKFRNSYSCLIDYLKSGLKILTSKPVAKITRNVVPTPAATVSTSVPADAEIVAANNNEIVEGVAPVVVTCNDGSQYLSKTAVVSVSAHVLKNKMISFEPSLDAEKSNALEFLHMRPAVKVYVKFSQICWPKHLQGMIMVDPNFLFPEIWFRDVTHLRGENEPAVCYATGFATSKYADRILSMTKEEVYAKFVEQLDTIFSQLEPRHCVPTLTTEVEERSVDSSSGSEIDHLGCSGESKTTGSLTPKSVAVDVSATSTSANLPLPSAVFLGGLLQDWQSANPYIGGGFCSPKAGCPTNAAEIFCEPVDNMIYFAGEATVHPGGTAHAALGSGFRAAKQVSSYLETLSKIQSVPSAAAHKLHASTSTGNQEKN
jgi:monoamine oxidase